MVLVVEMVVQFVEVCEYWVLGRLGVLGFSAPMSFSLCISSMCSYTKTLVGNLD